MCWRVASEMREQRGRGRAGTARKGHGRSRAGQKRGELCGRGGAGWGGAGRRGFKLREDVPAGCEGERSGQGRAGGAGREGSVQLAGRLSGPEPGDGGYAVICRRDARASGAGVAGSVRGGGGGVAQGSGRAALTVQTACPASAAGVAGPGRGGGAGGAVGAGSAQDAVGAGQRGRSRRYACVAILGGCNRCASAGGGAAVRRCGGEAAARVRR
jgi:hypothetical protein